MVIVGDSAGGGLAIALVLYLRQVNWALGKPESCIAYSPWLDLTHSWPSFTENSMDWLAKEGGDKRWMNGERRHYYTITNAMNTWPLVSPGYSQYDDLPPTLVKTSKIILIPS